MDICVSHPQEDDHPRTTLKSHLETVGERMGYFIDDSDSDKTSNKLKDLSRIIGYCHDIPKATVEFQEYLQENKNMNSPHNHAPSASVFTLGAAIESDIEFTDQDLMIAFSVVYNHHSRSLGDIGKQPHKKLFSTVTKTQQQLSEKNPVIVQEIAEKRLNQIASFDEGLRTVTSVLSSITQTNISSQTDLQRILENAKTWIETNFKDDFGTYREDLVTNSTHEKHLQLWSSLALADISHSARVTVPKKFERPTLLRLNSHIESLPTNSDLQKQREKARQEILSQTKNTDWTKMDIGTLSLPTGLGKTFSGLSAALQILDMRDIETTNNEQFISQTHSNVIYALPYTSIIDQAADVFEDTFDVSCSHSSRVTTHHYLSQTKSGSTNDEGKFIGKTWYSGITITTFVQLFETLLTPTRSSSMKLPQLQNSIIILDEPQSLPRKWWSLIQRLAKTLTSRYNARIISMTATQPYIFENTNDLETKSLVTQDEKYYNLDCVERVNYELSPSITSQKKSHTSYESVKEILKDSINTGSTLGVFNTVDSANKIAELMMSDPNSISINNLLSDMTVNMTEFKKNLDKISKRIKTKHSQENNYFHIHLTNRHRPIDRLRLISLIKTFEPSTPLVVTSTQILEAGVDVSFSTVVRDLAPLQNIVQSAGRCNRNNTQRNNGTVKIVSVPHPDDPEKTDPSKAIYNQGIDTIQITINLLKNVQESSGTISQKVLNYDTVQNYYQKLWQRTQGKQEYVNYYNKSKLGELSNLSLIESKHSADVLISERPHISDLRDAYNSYNFQEAENILSSLKNFEVSVPIWTDDDERKIHQLERLHAHDNTGKRLITEINQSNYYSYSFGFQIPESTAEHRIL